MAEDALVIGGDRAPRFVGAERFTDTGGDPQADDANGKPDDTGRPDQPGNATRQGPPADKGNPNRP